MEIPISGDVFRRALQISADLWNHPEVSGEERHASSLLLFNAAAFGFRTAAELDGIPNAFLAAWDTEGEEEQLQIAGTAGEAAAGNAPEEAAGAEGEGGAALRTPSAGRIPTVAFLAEYDALPGYGSLSPDGSGSAHACGHNWIAAAAFAAAVSLKKAAEKRKAEDPSFRARILLLGTPAEETWGAKIKMAEDRVFSSLGIDAAFECHLSGRPGTCFENRMLAQAEIVYTFHGKASHAAAHPEDGINALDAVNLAYQGIACLRQQVLPDTKLHGIITEGGTACNVIPDRTVMAYYVRSGKKDYLENVVERVNNCARGAALMTGCTVEIRRNAFTFYDIRNNASLIRRALEKLPGAAERAAQSEGLRAEEREDLTADAGRIRQDSVFGAVSGDIGNVSYDVPAFYGVFSTAPVSCGADVHDREYVAVTDSAYAHALLAEAASVMAETAWDVLTDRAFRESVRRDFERGILTE